MRTMTLHLQSLSEEVAVFVPPPTSRFTRRLLRGVTSDADGRWFAVFLNPGRAGEVNEYTSEAECDEAFLNSVEHLLAADWHLDGAPFTVEVPIPPRRRKRSPYTTDDLLDAAYKAAAVEEHWGVDAKW